MQFGKTEDIDSLHLKLPKDHPGNSRFLEGKRKTAEIYVGFPIWTHKAWVGTIYPEKAKPKDFLKYYSEQYNSIELNATHYTTPKISQVQAWSSVVPEHFKFCPKVPQFISHARNLAAMKNGMAEFMHAVSHFGKHLGCTFFLLSPNFKPPQLDSLIALLETVPESFELALELRHEDWFSDPHALDTLAAYLTSRKMVLIITDVSGRRDVLHQRLTSSTAFIRFTGNDLHPSDFKRLDDWVNRISEWLEHGLEKLYFFVHTPEKSLNPELTHYFIQKLNKKAGTNLPLPKRLHNKA
jgi:uncharacterized protein YecE (DUF72 family)